MADELKVDATKVVSDVEADAKIVESTVVADTAKVKVSLLARLEKIIKEAEAIGSIDIAKLKKFWNEIIEKLEIK